MELTYMVRGADGKEYGPVTLEQLNKWIQEDRLPAQQQVRRSDMEYWAVAGDFLELQPLFAALTPAAAESGTAAAGTGRAPAQADPATAARLKSGASWFYWIAGLSIINSIAAFSGSSWRFIVGLGVTQIFDALGTNFGGSGKIIVLVLDLLATGLFILFGVFAHKAHTWAFLAGLVLFGLDSVVFLIAQDWLGVGFHAFVLFFLFRGFQACRRLKGV